MKRKLMPSDFALWAALPMAQTSKVEGRLTRILNRNQSRGALTRGGVSLVAALTFGTILAIAVAETPPRSLMEALTSSGYSADTPARTAYLQAQIKWFGDSDPWAGKAYYVLGNEQMMAGRNDDALLSFSKAIALPEPPYPNSGIHSDARYEQINTLDFAGRYMEAAAETQTLLKNGGRGIIAADHWENLRERLPEFTMMRDRQVNRAAEQAQYRELTTAPRWTQTLSNGVTVHLLGVMQSSGMTHSAWSPEGKKISQAHYDSNASVGNYLGPAPMQKALLVLRLTYPAGKAAITEYSLSGAQSSNYQSGPDRDGGKAVTDEDAMNQETDGCRIVLAWFPAGQTQTNLRVGVALVPPPAGTTDPTNAPKEWAEFSNVTLPPDK